MAYEMVIARVIAPLLGDSLYTWSALIALVLVGMSLGAWAGGYASKKHHIWTLPLGYACAAFTIALVLVLPPALQVLITQSTFSLPLLALMVTAILTLVQTMALSFAGPLFMTLITDSLDVLGTRYSLISIAGSVGSIAGVLLGGFFLVPSLGTHHALIILSITALIMSGATLTFVRHKRILVIVSVLILGLATIILFFVRTHKNNPSRIATVDSPYYHIAVYDAPFGPHADARWLFLGMDSHSIDTHNKPNGLYTDAGFLLDALVKPERTLVLGAGAYTIPKILAEKNPEATIDVIEIDPMLESIGREYFNLGTYPQITTHVGDPRYLLPRLHERYDLIFNDIYNSFISVPSHTVTQEFLELVRTRLNPRGLYVAGFIGTLEGEGKRITEHMIATAHSVFGDVRVISFGRTDATIQSILIIASPDVLPFSDEVFAQALDMHLPSYVRMVTLDTAHVRSITDTWQPVETLMRPIMRDYFDLYKKQYYDIVADSSLHLDYK
jgi:spermidine synthase